VRPRIDTAYDPFIFAGADKSIEQLLASMVKGENIIVVSMSKGDALCQTIVDVEKVQANPKLLNVMSYRWDDGATAFADQFNWSEALKSLAQSARSQIPIPDKLEAAEFYRHVQTILKRIGVKYMWIDQLSIPQKRDETMPIVHASGSFYRQFEVFVWLPWALRSNKELLVRMQTANSEDAKGSYPITNEIAAEVSALYLQFKRGWILRESNVTCFPSKKERERNLKHLHNAKYVLSRKIKDKREYYASNEGVSALTIGTDRDFNNWVKANGEVDHVCQVIESMTGTEMDLSMRVISAARITIAPFTVESDREVVAEMDSMKMVCEIRHTSGRVDKLNPFYRYLKTIMFLGCLAFRDRKYYEFSDFNYSPSDCKLFLNWLFTTCAEFVSYSETLWNMFLNRLQTGRFTAFLPSDYPLKDISKYAPFTIVRGDEENDEVVAVVVSRWGVVLQKINKAQKEVVYFDEIDKLESISKLLDVVSNPRGYAEIYVCWRLPPGEKAENEQKKSEDYCGLEKIGVEVGHSDENVIAANTEVATKVHTDCGEEIVVKTGQSDQNAADATTKSVVEIANVVCDTPDISTDRNVTATDTSADNFISTQDPTVENRAKCCRRCCC